MGPFAGDEKIHIGDSVQTTFTGDAEPTWVEVTGFGKKNGEPVIDVRQADGTSRWQYVERITDVHCPNDGEPHDEDRHHLAAVEDWPGHLISDHGDPQLMSVAEATAYCIEHGIELPDSEDEMLVQALATHEKMHSEAERTPSQQAFDAVAQTFLADYRKRLGLSRREVQEATNLGGSVVWRADQDQAKVTAEQRTKIYDFLVQAEQEINDGTREDKKTPKPLESQKQAAKVKELQLVIDAAAGELVTIIDQLKTKKVGTANLAALLEQLRPHTTK